MDDSPRFTTSYQIMDNHQYSIDKRIVKEQKSLNNLEFGSAVFWRNASAQVASFWEFHEPHVPNSYWFQTYHLIETQSQNLKEER